MRLDTDEYANEVADEFVFFYKRDFGQNPPSQAVSAVADAAKAIMKGRRFGPDFLTKKALEKSLKNYISAVNSEPLKIGECVSCLAYYCMGNQVGDTVTAPDAYWVDDVVMPIVGPYMNGLF